jgi:putative hydrolase of the HAD superfamily
MTPSRHPRNIVFDVGKVLIDFRTENFIEFLMARGASVRTTAEFTKHTKLYAYERGEISSQEFLRRVSALLSVKIEPEQLKLEWLKMFQPKKDMLLLLGSLDQTYRRYLLSNTNEMHWGFLEEEYRLGARVHGVMTSFQAGAMKPDAAIYQKLEEVFGLSPEETLLIDDMPENIEAALARGWQGIAHTSYKATLAELDSRGIRRVF